MRQILKRALFSVTLVTVYASTCLAAGLPRHDAEGVVIPLYAPASLPSLEVPELHEQLETGETLIYDVSEPTLEMYRAAPGRETRTAIIVVPGGGFVALGYVRGGTDIARALADQGITAFVLKHRTLRSGDGPMRIPAVHMQEMELVVSRARLGTPIEMPVFAGEPAAVEDGIQAMAIVRSRAGEWGIDPQRIGMLGFSSGAYLAADLAIGSASTRPDFVGLIYGGLRTPVPADAPPAFIAGAADDAYQPDDPILLYRAWREAGATAELHIYERGGHGFDLHPQGTTSDHWFTDITWWIESHVRTGAVLENPADQAHAGDAG